MADENVQVAEATQAQQPDLQAELAQQMQFSLGIGQGVANEQAQTAEQQPTVTEPGATTVTEPNVQSDPFGFLKEKFGYQTHEAAIQEIEDLRAFKAQPRPTEFQIPDDESGAFLRAIAAGDKAKVHQFLDHEMRIERLLTNEVNKDTAGEIVKMGMQLKYKDLTPEEINYKFNKQFAVPPKPEQTIDEEDTDYQNRLASWQDQVTDRQMELMIEAKLAKPDLQNSKGKFTIPEIESPVDEGYIQYKQMLEQKSQDEKAIVEAYKTLAPKAIETKLNFKDEANKIEFQYQFEPDAAKFAKAVEMACDQQQFWNLFTKPDGNPDRERFLDMICFAIDKESYLMSAMNQAKNATIKASLPDNSQGGLIKQITQNQEPSELDREMRISLKGYGGY